jgi:uncharacterized membrane protein
LVFGYEIGAAVGNIFSPFAGLYELIFMPIMRFAARMLGYLVAKRFKNNCFIGGAVVATVISIGLSWVLSQLFSPPMLETFPHLFFSEQTVCFIGASMLQPIERRFKGWLCHDKRKTDA